jgi:mannose/fructose/N-acetylgalactosamine-specific phosphotransferase system component IID
MPLAIGYVVIEMIGRQFQTTGVIVTSICFITAWLLLRKHQWRLIQESWEAGFKLSSSLIEPIEKLMGKIWKGAEKIGEAIRA